MKAPLNQRGEDNGQAMDFYIGLTGKGNDQLMELYRTCFAAEDPEQTQLARRLNHFPSNFACMYLQVRQHEEEQICVTTERKQLGERVSYERNHRLRMDQMEE